MELSGTYGAQIATEDTRTAPTASTKCWRVNKRKGSVRKGPEQTCVLVCILKVGGRVELLEQQRDMF